MPHSRYLKKKSFSLLEGILENIKVKMQATAQYFEKTVFL